MSARHWTPAMRTDHAPAACFPSAPTSQCRHCTRNHGATYLREAARRHTVVIDASTIARRTGECGMFNLPPAPALGGENRRAA